MLPNTTEQCTVS